MGAVTDRVAQRIASRLGVDPRSGAEVLASEVEEPGGLERAHPAAPPPPALVRLGAPHPPRIVRSVPTLEASGELVPPAEGSDGAVRVLAEPFDGLRCRLHVGHRFADGKGWWFENRQAADRAPLAASLFQHANLKALLVDDRTLVATRDEREAGKPWGELATSLAGRLRAHLASGLPVLPEPLVSQIPLESEIRNRILAILETEVNPEISAHSGRIELLRVRGNSVWIRMGGGCQGCASAEQTLRIGIDRAFRRGVPALAGIYDETDHRAGESPYFR